MKTFETPYVEVKKFAVEDILTTSSGGDDCSADSCWKVNCTENTEGPCPDDF